MTDIGRAIRTSLQAIRRRRLAPVQVAVVDSGIDATHRDLRRRVKAAWKLVMSDESVRPIKVSGARNNDVFGHGTAVGGIIASIAPNARLVDVRVLDEYCQGRGAVLVAGFEQAIASGARLINLSLACVAEYATQLHELCEQAYRENQIVIAAKRNMPLVDNGFPAEFSSCISVDLADFRSPYTLDFLDPPPIEFAARGESVRVPAAGGGYTRMTGTSFATPTVTGLCALLVGAYPDYCRRRLRLSMVTPPGTDYGRVAEWLRANHLEAAMSSLVDDDTGEFERAYREHPVTGVDQLRRDLIEAGCRGTLDDRRGQLEFSVHAVLFMPTLWLLRRRPVPTSPRDRAIRRGMCIPSSERLFVDSDGDLFPCEKTDGRRHLHLGHIDSGVDVRKVYDILVAFHEFLAEECASCWLWRLCRVCLPGPTAGNGYDRDKARRLCEGHRDAMPQMLKMYCTVLERNPTALDFLLNEDRKPGAMP